MEVFEKTISKKIEINDLQLLQVEFNEFQKILLWCVHTEKNANVIKALQDPQQTIMNETYMTKSWEEWKSD